MAPHVGKSSKNYFQFEKDKYFSYFEEISAHAKELERELKKTKFVVAVPVHADEPTLLKFFECYRSQDFDPNLFEIILFLNRRPGDSSFQHLESEINFVQNKSKLNISYFKKTFKHEITIGYIRKYLIDTILLTEPESRIIINNDADLEELSPRYLKEIFLRTNQQDGLYYRLSDIPLYIDEFTTFSRLIHFYFTKHKIINNTRLSQLGVRLVGSNMVFSSDAYYKVGGFDPALSVGEDISFAFKIIRIFGMDFAQELQEKFISSFRRYFETYAQDWPLFYTWAEWEKRNVRKLSLDDLWKKITEKEKSIDPRYFEEELEQDLHYCENEIGKYIAKIPGIKRTFFRDIFAQAQQRST